MPTREEEDWAATTYTVQERRRMERTLKEELDFVFESRIDPERAEAFIRELARADPANTKVTLRFVGYPYVTPGAGWRVGNALRPYSGKLLKVEVPPLGDDWFRTFTRSGLGVAIATHAGKITCQGVDVSSRLKSLYLDRKSRPDQNAVFFGDLHQGLGVNPEREDLFREAFLGSLKKVNARPTNFDRDKLQDVIKFAFEAIQNVYDHAWRKPLHEETKVVSYFLLGYYKSISDHPDPTGRLWGYGERLSALTKRTRTDFLQVCVNDDGVGIAARHLQDLDIYQGPLEEEEAAVRDALKRNSSVKLIAQDCRVRGVSGFGYTYIESCLRSLRALAVLRTGRLLAFLDGADESGDGFNLHAGELGYLPGTTLDVLIPILKEGDGQPTLFSD
jgi:hypothetical protein